MVTDFDKVPAGQACNTKRFYIVFGIHRGKLVVGVVDKPVETVARLCGHAVVVDEDMMAHTQQGDGNLLMYAGTTGHYYRMVQTRHYDQRPFDETVCDAIIANGGVKNLSKRRKMFAMTDASNTVQILVACAM